MIRDYVTAPDAAIDISKIAGGAFGSLFGKTFYVDSTHARATTNTGAGQKSRPFSTVASALSALATRGTGNGDVILVAPRHTETIIAAGGWNFSTGTRTDGSATIPYHKGVRVVGVGNGRTRPLISFTTAVGASILIDADGVTIENFCLDLNDLDALTQPVDVNAVDCTLRNIFFQSGDATNQPTRMVDVASAAARCTIVDCLFSASANAGTTSAIVCAAATHLHVLNSYFVGAFANGAIEFTAATTRVLIKSCQFHNSTAASTVCITGFAGVDGHVRDCTFAIEAATGAASVIGTPGNLRLYLNSSVSSGGNEYGIEVGGGAST